MESSHSPVSSPGAEQGGKSPKPRTPGGSARKRRPRKKPSLEVTSPNASDLIESDVAPGPTITIASPSQGSPSRGRGRRGRGSRGRGGALSPAPKNDFGSPAPDHIKNFRATVLPRDVRSAPTTPQKPRPAPPPQPRSQGRPASSARRGTTPSTPSGRSRSRRSRARFEEYWTKEQIEAGITAGVVQKATLRVNPHRRREAYATCVGLPQDVLIDGVKDQNRAFEGDVVYLEIFPESKWQSMSNNNNAAAAKPDESDSSEPEEDDESVKDLSQALESSLKLSGEAPAESSAAPAPANLPDRRPTGRVVGIAEDLHKTQRFVGVLKHQGSKKPADVDTATFFPNDKRAPLFMVPLKQFQEDFNRNTESFEKRLFLIEFVRWGAESMIPRGRIVEELGQAGDLVAESQALLSEHNIDDRPHSAEMIRSLPDKFVCTAKDLAARRDFRETHRIFSIDPATTRDVDDALSIQPLPDGCWEVGVHIADVSHYVKPNTPLDREAQRRSTSTYLVDRCIPMLPPILSEILCSINPREERFAFSVVWKLDEQGNIKEEWIGKSIIRSCAKLAYEDAQVVIDTALPDGSPSAAGIDKIGLRHVEKPAHEIAADILALHKIAQNLRRKRFESGAIRLNRVKLYFDLDTTVSPPKPTSFRHYEQKPANELVEEYMLLANMSTANFILQHFPKAALLRRHPPPQERKMREYLRLMESLHIALNPSSVGTILESLRSQPKEHIPLLEDLLTRTMQPAVYFSAGDVQKTSEMHHYALNVPVYTHFTSPIRRYPDIIVHRLLELALRPIEAGKDPLPPHMVGFVSDICKNANQRKLAARKAQERSQTVYLCVWLHEHAFVDNECRVLEIGEKFVKFYSHTIGKSVRVFVGALEDKGVKTSWSEETKTMTLTWKAGEQERTMALTFFQQLPVKFGASDKVPMDLEATLLLDGLTLHLGEVESE